MSQGTGYRGEVRRIALAGGIGAGKSTVVDYLRAKGFIAVDADEVYADLVSRGQPLLDVLVDAFGAAVVTPDGDLNRTFLGSIVFADATARARLDAITHPVVGREMRRRLDEARGEAVFVAIPLFRHEHRESLAIDEVWSVHVAPEVAEQRLVDQRALSPAEARARIASQMDNASRESLSDVVIWNNTDRDALRGRVDELLKERGLDGH